jgi:chitinase
MTIGLQKEELLRDRRPDRRFQNPFSTTLAKVAASSRIIYATDRQVPSSNTLRGKAVMRKPATNRSRYPLTVSLCLCISAFMAFTVPSASQAAVWRLIGYYAQWATYARNYEPADIPATKLTHINYAFVELSNTGELYSIDSYADFQKVYPAKNGLPAQTWEQAEKNLAGNFGRLRDLKVLYPNLKILISLGGWGWDGPFSGVAADPVKRAAFAASCAVWVSQQGMDGIDIDWEYPSAGDRDNFTAMLQEVRTQLNALGQQDGKPYYLTVAAPAGQGNMGGFDIAAVAGMVDWINLMTYDYHGSTWENATGFNAPLYADSTDPFPDKDTFNLNCTVSAYLTGGAPAGKLNMGMALYGRSWEAVPNVNHGLFQTGQAGPNQGTNGNWESGMFDYWRVVQLSQDGQHNRYWNDSSKVPFLYGPNITSGLSGGMFVSYDDPQSIGEKVRYLKDKGLGGAMFWELSGDIRTVSDPNSLIGFVNKAFAGAPDTSGAISLLLLNGD